MIWESIATTDEEVLIAHWDLFELTRPNNKGVTRVGFAVGEGQADTVKLLVSLGVEVNPPPDNWGDTPLSEAKTKGYSAIVEILLGAGAEWSMLVDEAALDKGDESIIR